MKKILNKKQKNYRKINLVKQKIFKFLNPLKINKIF